MSKENKISIVDGNIVEVHYWFNDNSHLMDAFIQNRCEYELLGIIKEISNTFKIEIIIETEPFVNGGLRRWFKLTSKEENKKATITTTIITALLTTILVTPLSTSISTLTEKVIDEIFDDPEIKDLEKEKLKLEIEKLRQEIGHNINTLDRSSVVKKKKSNFYDSLNSYQKVDGVSFMNSDHNKQPLIVKKVPRDAFKEFILASDELEPENYDGVVIEIISPVLKKGSYKWMGIYKGHPVPFSMKSKEFKELVQKGDVQFRNGTSIICNVTVKKKIDNEGLEKITNIDVISVNQYFENDKPVETPEGRKYRKKKEADVQQLKFFATNNDTEL